MFADLDEVLDGGLPLKVGGRPYLVPEPTIRQGLALVRVFAENDGKLDDATELAEAKKILGPIWDQFNRDGVGHSKSVFAGRYALLHYTMGPGTAQAYVRQRGVVDAGNPLPPKPTRYRGKHKNKTQPPN
ncbi:DUF7426 family protein [Rhodococcoides fascians]|uniref:DUF7426 family protein n=1 Tax=Rhodococcoides fascians TaxID=1828 RepID=UPI00055E195A|nr:hypothetical protein [Rhodococcus fascians]